MPDPGQLASADPWAGHRPGRKDASATRVRNRDAVDGRPRGYLRRFGLSRINFRARAHAGHLPGVRKSSW